MTKNGSLSSGSTTSCWVSPQISAFSPLAKNIDVDVAIIGAGIAGLSIAYALLKEGKSIAVIEDGRIGSGETGRTSAHLATVLDERFFKLAKRFGNDGARLIAKGQQEAINTIQTIIKSESILCDFKRVDGYLFANEDDRENLAREKDLLTELKALPFEWVQKAPFANFDTGPCLKFKDQAQIEPMKYLSGLAQALINKGAGLYEGTHASYVTKGLIVTSQGYRIQAKDIVVATGAPINARISMPLKQTQYRTYVLLLEVPKGQIEEALYWDMLQDYHYIRVVPTQEGVYDRILLGGQDHKTGREKDPKKVFLALEEWAKKLFNSFKTINQWSGQVIEPFDKTAFIGRHPHHEHIFIHTGTSGNGLTYGALSGAIIRDLIMERSSPYAALYDPSRKCFSALPKCLHENLSTATQYLDWFEGSDNLKNLKPEEGAIIRKGLNLQAIYHDKNGKLHHLSAVCPHLGGVVRWNGLEKTWDCPCHGSRFAATGEVINGPANKNLKKLA